MTIAITIAISILIGILVGFKIGAGTAFKVAQEAYQKGCKAVNSDMYPENPYDTDDKRSYFWNNGYDRTQFSQEASRLRWKTFDNTRFKEGDRIVVGP